MRRQFRSARLALVALTLLLPVACGRPRPIEARPALWRVSDADTTIWLLGTIHVLPANVRWQTPAIRDAIDHAVALVMELPDDPAGTTRTFEAMASANGLPPIAERISPARRAVLAAALKAGGVDARQIDGKKSWAAAFIIAGAPNAAKGVTRENGVEARLSEAFAARHLPSSGLETAAAQFATFDRLPEAAQRVLLDRAIDSAASGSADYQATLAAWAAGDERRIAATIDPAFRAAPEIAAQVVRARNSDWAGKIAARMARPGRVLVAVGVGHLVGSDSLPAMLRARGLKVQRIE
ncbi:TraB/GumN family protein [Sphingomonas sp. RT2P30]|uniref:TraB/GumN family protein n=1 Tax=Parasphingomonas halimpatiens TaxID=3096162 RepID=UPI002FCBFBD8